MTRGVHLDSVKETLEVKGVRNVVIIDDCFDDAGNIVKPEAIDDFFVCIQNADNAEELLEILGRICGRPIHSSEDIPTEAITKLDEDVELRKPFDSVWEPVDQSLRNYGRHQLDDFTALLKEDLNLATVDKLGRLDAQLDSDAEIIFIDYILDPDAIESGRDLAVARIKEIYNNYGEGEKPVVVLMSSRSPSKAEVEEFCQDSELLPGVFFFAPKRALKDPFELAFKMRTYAMASETGHWLQQFIHRLQKEAGEVASVFAQRLRKLSVNDYGYIQYLSLREDGQPLGEYLTWIFSCSLNHRLFADKLNKERLALDRVVYPEPPSLADPSDLSKIVAELYNCAVFDTTERELGSHPTPGCGNEDGTDLYLKLGDVLRHLHKLLVVVNPECDLSYGREKRSDGEKARSFPSDLSILLLPGTLTPLSEGSEPFGGTDLICLEDGDFRITWNVKEIQAVRFGSLLEWLNKRGYKLIARMRIPHALRLQSEIAHNITRVGTPVPAPFHRHVQVEIFLAGSHDPWDADHDLKVVIVRSQRKSHLVIPENVLLKARNGLEEVLRQVAEEHDNLSSDAKGESKKIQLTKKMEKYRAVLDDPGEWFQHQEPIVWPPKKKKPLGDLPVAVVPEGMSDRSSQYPVIIQLTGIVDKFSEPIE